MPDKKSKKKGGAKREKPPGTSVVDENTAPNDIVEALLREFMYRKGLGHILDAFDVSRPRGDKTINSVKAVYQALRLDEIYARMRGEDKGVSVFEVLVAHAFKKPDAAAPSSPSSEGAGSGGGNGGGTPRVAELEKKLRAEEESRQHAEKQLADLKLKFVAQKRQLDAAREEAAAAKEEAKEAEMQSPAAANGNSKAGRPGDRGSGGPGATATPPPKAASRFGLSGLPSLAGQAQDPLSGGAVVVGGGVLKVKTKKTPPGERKAVKFVDNEDWLKVEDVREAASAAKATGQPVVSVVYYRDADPTTLLSPVPFSGTYYHKLATGELDKGSQEVEDAIEQGRDGPNVIKLDSSEVSKYYVGRIVDSINESGIAVVVDIVSDGGDGRGRGAIFISPLSVAGRHRCRPPPEDYNPPTASQAQNQQSKLCKHNCGFFGSSEFDGACSKCHENAQKEASNSAVKTDLFGGGGGAGGGGDDDDDDGDDYSDEDFDDPDYDFSDF